MNKTQLFGTWRHAHEEDGPQRLVYRRGGASLPPSRGRDALELEPDGTAIRTSIDPADRPAPQPCEWHLEGNEVVLTDGETELRRMRIVEATADTIVFEKRSG